MKPIKTWSASLTTALLLAACGGGGNDAPPADTQAQALSARRPFTAVVSFGDSLSDVGTYTPKTAIPGTSPTVYLGGKFTTNSPTSKIWVENVAARLGLVVNPAVVGWNGIGAVQDCPAAAQGLGATCTAYGQGGARVTDPIGIRHEAGALTVPIQAQIANHLSHFKSFKSTDLIFLWAGANDLLWQMEQDPAKNPESFVVKLFTIQAQAQAGLITPADAQLSIDRALAASQAVMRTAALEMTGYIRTQILAKGGKYVVVMTLPDGAVTPEGVATTAFSPELGAALTALSDAFNQGLKDGLKGQPVQTIDIRGFISDVVAHPADHQMANASVPACDATKMARITNDAVTDGFSLFCNATPGAPYNGIRDGANVNTWFFADGNHPTVGGYRLISDEVMRQLRRFGWVRGEMSESTL